MKVKDILNNEKKVFSFEFFPPKTDKGAANLYSALSELKELHPDYVSVTYGALGSTQEKSLNVIRKIHGDLGVEVMAHYTCIGGSEEKVDAFLEEIIPIGVENILALRGDAPEGMSLQDALGNSPFHYAIDLVKYIKKKTDRFSIGVAGYPEKHPEAKTMEEDIQYLKAKVDAGADFIVTQLFFNNADFFSFRDQAEKAGITVPIIPGIMPLENFKQIEKITSMCGAKVPDDLKAYLTDRAISDEDKITYGVSYTTKQCQELLAGGVKGIHFYTLNKSSATREIFRNLH